MSSLREMVDDLGRGEGAWCPKVEVILAALVERLEPTCHDVAEFYKDDEPAEPRAEAADGWLAEFEKAWRCADQFELPYEKARVAHNFVPRLIAAAKELNGLHAEAASWAPGGFEGPEHAGCNMLISTLRREVEQAETRAHEANCNMWNAESERDALRAQVAALTKERDEALFDLDVHRRIRRAQASKIKKLWAEMHTPKREKPSRSKPNEVRARIKRDAWTVSIVHSELSRMCYVRLRLDNVVAVGYAYRMIDDLPIPSKGRRLALRRAYDALESALRANPATARGQLVSQKGASVLWEWWRITDQG